jgi:hypothetical protein
VLARDVLRLFRLENAGYLVFETLREANEPPLRRRRPAIIIFWGYAYIFESCALVILQQPVLRAVVPLAEPAVTDDPLSGVLALVEGATGLLGGHVCEVGCWGGCGELR